MNKVVQNTLFFTGVALLSLLLGSLTAYWLEKDSPSPATDQAASQAPSPDIRPSFALPDLDNKTRSIEEWNGKVVLLNFWATWCPPCLKEMPAFMQIREELSGQGFEVVGVAIDQTEAVQDFVDQLGIEYPILMGEVEGMPIMKAYGNYLYTLPYTVIIDQRGKIIKTFRTEVDKDDILEVVMPLLGADK